MDKIKNFFKGVGRWFKNHVPTRRRIIQVYAALLTNANLKGFGEGQIYTGGAKKICTPGLNCYSCPGAVMACPLGALQNSLGASNITTPYYILGILALLGLALGRTICGFLCPFGLVQELLFKVRTPKVKKSAYTRLLSYLKYLLLITLVIAVPLIYHNVPAFCKYICPAGTLGGSVSLLANESNADFYSMLGYLFSWKFVILVCTVILCIFVYRGFCRFFCPLGAIYGFFNKIALLGVKLEKSKCIDCGMCISKCKMDIRHVGDHECINCGECIPVCPTKAISWKGGKIFLEPTSVAVTASDAPVSAAPTLNSIISSGIVHIETEYEKPAERLSTVTEALESETPVEAAAEDTAAEKVAQPKMRKVTYRRKKSSFILEAVAWTLAAAILVTALVYFNTLPPARVTAGEVIPDFTAETYDTAYNGDGYTLHDNGSRPTMIILWSSRNEASIEYISSLKENFAEISESANVVAVHVVNSDSRETVQSIIDSNGWKDYDIPFVQDTDELDIYSNCGGDGSFPLTVFLTVHNEEYSHHVGPLTADDVKAEIKDLRGKTVFREGDKIFDFTVRTYESAYKQGTFSTESARGKVLVINFWYTSCGPCVEELPYFEEVQEEYGDRITILALHSNNDEVPIVQSFIDREEPNNNKYAWSDWQIIFGQDVGSEYDSNAYYTMLGGKGAYPVTMVIDSEGYIVKIVQSSIINHDKDNLRPAIEEALAR